MKAIKESKIFPRICIVSKCLNNHCDNRKINKYKGAVTSMATKSVVENGLLMYLSEKTLTTIKLKNNKN